MNLKEQLEERSRPRERALKEGFDTLRPADLIAVLIGSGSRGENVVELCERILDDHDNKLYRIARRSVADLMKMYRGIGEVKALQILAAIELSRRYQDEKLEDEDNVITSHADAYKYLRHKMTDLPHEEFWMLVLNRAKRVTDRVRISSGGTAMTVVDVKMVLRTAVERLADSIIIAHNHPSDNATPSVHDDDLTARVKRGCEAVGIPLLDHLIMCRCGRYYSYADHGRL